MDSSEAAIIPLDGDIGLIQFDGILIEKLSDSGDVPLKLRKEKERSSLSLGRVVRGTLLNAVINGGTVAHHLREDGVVLYREESSFPARFWFDKSEFHVISPDDIVAEIALPEDSVSGILESYGELIEDDE
jgi:hypothetical protein